MSVDIAPDPALDISDWPTGPATAAPSEDYVAETWRQFRSFLGC